MLFQVTLFGETCTRYVTVAPPSSEDGFQEIWMEERELSICVKFVARVGDAVQNISIEQEKLMPQFSFYFLFVSATYLKVKWWFGRQVRNHPFQQNSLQQL